MDYIREELLRQKKVLAVLMSGGAREQGDADRAETAETVMSDLSWHTRAESARERVFEGAVLDRTKQFPFRGLMRGVGNRVAASELGDTVSSAIGMGWSDYPDVLRTPAYMAPYERSVTEGTTDVRAVSRSIQRDARRYDGGFSIY